MCRLVLVALTALGAGTLSSRRTDVPLEYWSADSDPARSHQIATFMKWMKDNGYGAVELRLDTNNLGTMKVIIQADLAVESARRRIALAETS